MKELSVRELKGIGEKTEKLLKKLKIETVSQLIHHYPRCYMTYPEPTPISKVRVGERCSIEAKISSTVNMRASGKMKIITCLVADETGQFFLRWFNMPYLRNTLHQGDALIFTGIPVYKQGRVMMDQPEFFHKEKYLSLMETYQPVYPLTFGLSNKLMQKTIKAAFDVVKTEEFLPENLLQYYNLIGEEKALYEVHFPGTTKTLNEAKRRIIFDEFFRFFVALELVKDHEHQTLNHYVITGKKEVDQFILGLPYELTGAQKDALEDIRSDFGGTMAMNRLIQGDVGSGKTIVAAIAMFSVTANGYQAALMAPTEVLAMQHYEKFKQMFEPFGVRVGYLVSSMKIKEKRQMKTDIKEGRIDMVIGTHALIQEDVEFHNLALAITDEQHRFGVKQRDDFMKKGYEPHVLVMSATPIPRTLGMILYRDLDVTIMNELPASRLPIKNAVVGQKFRPKAWEFIKKEVAAGHQAYVICPMIEENENLDVENVQNYTTMLSQALPLSIKVQSLNGKMNAKEKNEIMDSFGAGEIDVLVSTTVIEVGIDVPNATVILIENAERFGLAQLHQLRGRVGRGKAQSYCIFLSGSDDKNAMDRLNVIGHSNDGFEIANEDLKLRGPGEFFGTRQSGTMEFALGDIYSNADILKEASQAVDYLKNTDYDFFRIYEETMDQELNYARDI